MGARPKTQILDIAHGLHLALEKALDDHSRGAIAQLDIEKYYDSIRLLIVGRWLVSHGCPVALAACALRQQMMPQVSLNISGVDVAIPARSCGSLTGSRVAGTLARVPVESTIQARHAHWKRWGFKCDRGALTVSTYVDNLYSVSHSLAGAIAILDDFAEVLASSWRLRIKPSSRLCLVARGLDEQPASPLWSLRSEFPVLGHILQDNGFVNICFHNASHQMWRAFFANSGAATAAKLSLKDRMALLQRSVAPILNHRDTRWPPNQKTAADINRLQRKMVASIQRVARTAGESPADFARRRNRLATAQIGHIGGAWSATHCQRVLDWDAHCRRPRNGNSWAAMLLDYHGESWLNARRLECQRDSQSRLDSRACCGGPAPRWHEGVNYAKAAMRR